MNKTDNNQWYEVIKTWSAGSNVGYLLLTTECDEKDVQYYCENWGEISNGGHSNGYFLEWEKVDRPPKEWLQSEIKTMSINMQSIAFRIDKFNEYLEDYD